MTAKYIIIGFMLLVMTMMIRHPDIFFGAIDKLDAQLRRFATWLFK